MCLGQLLCSHPDFCTVTSSRIPFSKRQNFCIYLSIYLTIFLPPPLSDASRCWPDATPSWLSRQITSTWCCSTDIDFFYYVSMLRISITFQGTGEKYPVGNGSVRRGGKVQGQEIVAVTVGHIIGGWGMLGRKRCWRGGATVWKYA